MEAKPFASLSSGLLARKGAARPAMRPQGFGQVGNGLEDLGWNDMGFEPPKPAEVSRDVDHDAFGDDVVEHPRAHPTGLTPIQSPVHDQQAEIVERLNAAGDAEDEEIDETAEIYDPEQAEAASIEAGPLEPLGAGPLEAEPPEAEPPEVEPLEAAPIEEAIIAQIYESVAAPVAVAAPAPRRAPRPRAAQGSKAKAAFTLRLDPERHLRLRLACAVDGRSAQQLVT
ncbi:MAG TPA: hypothetical protein VJ846_09970, partial [Sphingomicrobium sp.]|nr:hypothetical protein [Sphingomicrobium sp.]